MEQERMANMEEFCGHELVISTRQHVFTHRERAGQRGFVDVTSEAQHEEGENPPAEVRHARTGIDFVDFRVWLNDTAKKKRRQASKNMLR